MSQSITRWLLVFVAITQFLPVVGVFGSELLATLYEIDIDDPNLAVLLQHRAVLFGILGALIGFAAFQPSLQPLAMTIATVMITSFVALWGTADAMNPAMDRLAAGDLIALIALFGAAISRAGLDFLRTHSVQSG